MDDEFHIKLFEFVFVSFLFCKVVVLLEPQPKFDTPPLDDDFNDGFTFELLTDVFASVPFCEVAEGADVVPQPLEFDTPASGGVDEKVLFESHPDFDTPGEADDVPQQELLNFVIEFDFGCNSE